MTCDRWSTRVGARMYNFADSNLKKNLTMQRGDPRGVRGVSFAVRTCAYKHACAISSALNVRVTYAGVTSEISRIHTSVSMTANPTRDFRIFAALTRQRYVSRAYTYVYASRTEWVTSRATVTSRRPSNARPPQERERVASACRARRRGRSFLQ